MLNGLLESKKGLLSDRPFFAAILGVAILFGLDEIIADRVEKLNPIKNEKLSKKIFSAFVGDSSNGNDIDCPEIEIKEERTSERDRGDG